MPGSEPKLKHKQLVKKRFLSTAFGLRASVLGVFFFFFWGGGVGLRFLGFRV